MTEIELDDIAPLRGPRGPRTGGEPRARRQIPKGPRGSFRPTRRTVLGGVASAGFGLGMSVLGVFPAARQAAASGYYDVKGLPCPSYAGPHNCSPGCGPSRVCATCCRTSGRRRGFHHSSYSKANHKLRPNHCYGGWADGWLWKYSARCGPCRRSRTYRCHDGWKRNTSRSPFYRTICRWTTQCS